ncbi:regulator of secondary metabolism LaeA [Verticillium alfalfae VaMs.102]|uniref:Regulator of secondary metabolism LaeA n=1 Tax=Verticillium alfalfae (strain VaMs.102 / ATCC MYA-4576 / FGSC 10136) TaxID=526221 RepID=C9SQY8_VERA1|nr:regulator of secondary metabolism LaeA [Verticillium alfalfae VaMs.102]EEY21263.1 regulator of secondary metabolism LaeA [Verticillium alfalfae VaMs.102]
MSINGYYSPSAAPPDSKCSYIANQSSVISRNSGTQGHRENGRVYGEFRPGRYLFPIDEEEKDRFDVFHRVVSLARQNKHFDNEVPDRARVLDLGTGTGIWAIDVSDALWKGPENHGLVHGLDLAYIQPADVPSTVSFMQADVEEPWPLRENDYDLIHIQLLMGGIRDWTDLYRKIFRHSSGGLERSCTSGVTKPFGTPLDINDRIKGDLQAIGFTDVTETIVKLPINPWADNKHDQELGRWFNLAATHAVNAMSLAPLTRVEGWPVEQVQSLGSEVKKNLCKLSIHAYCRLPDAPKLDESTTAIGPSSLFHPLYTTTIITAFATYHHFIRQYLIVLEIHPGHLRF